jgi:CubicO group peptidase (beta-lactamase class C family)
MLLSTASLAQIRKDDPPPGSLRTGETALVDDGSCPEGQIKEVTGGDVAKGIGRTTRCISRSEAAAAGEQARQPQALKAGLEIIRTRYNAKGAVFRLEEPGHEPVEVVSGTATAGQSVGVGSISKSVTAIGIALLIQQGKLTLDSTLGDVLSGYFAKRKSTLDPTLRPLTIARLLSHRAGLSEMNARVPAPTVPERIKTSHFFDYYLAIAAAKRGGSNGKDDFVYSNLSYILLGMVIEAVSGDGYTDFCQRNIFGPLGIKSATVPSFNTFHASEEGWQMNLADVLKLWSVFDITQPTLLSEATLQATLLGKFGGPIRPNVTVYYMLGAYVRQDRANGPYVLNHDGVARAFDPVTYVDYVEKFVPGRAWAISLFPAPPKGKPWPADLDAKIARDVRAMLRGELRAN